jgi:hypothetical protein
MLRRGKVWQGFGLACLGRSRQSRNKTADQKAEVNSSRQGQPWRLAHVYGPPSSSLPGVRYDHTAGQFQRMGALSVAAFMAPDRTHGIRHGTAGAYFQKLAITSHFWRFRVPGP